jgi:hypothetical protein
MVTDNSEYEVRLWCESGDLVAYAKVKTGVSYWEVDYYTDHYIRTDPFRRLDNAENSARRWIIEQEEYDTEGHSVQIIRDGQDVSADPTEQF